MRWLLWALLAVQVLLVIIGVVHIFYEDGQVRIMGAIIVLINVLTAAMNITTLAQLNR